MTYQAYPLRHNVTETLHNSDRGFDLQCLLHRKAVKVNYPHPLFGNLWPRKTDLEGSGHVQDASLRLIAKGSRTVCVQHVSSQLVQPYAEEAVRVLAPLLASLAYMGRPRRRQVLVSPFQCLSQLLSRPLLRKRLYRFQMSARRRINSFETVDTR